MPTYFSPESVHFCFTSDGAVFLDVQRDEYLGLNKQEAQTLRRLIEKDSSSDVELTSLAEVLVANGLIATSSSERTRPLQATTTDAAEGLLIDADTLDDVPAISARHVLNFLLACVTVWCAFRIGNLARAIRRLRARKRRAMRDPRYADPANVQSLIRIFVHLRLFAYTARQHCLYDSLVLCDFLQRFGVVPTCVFGVRTLPFGAHCWVVVDRQLATESNAQQISVFAPILVV